MLAADFASANITRTAPDDGFVYLFMLLLNQMPVMALFVGVAWLGKHQVSDHKLLPLGLIPEFAIVVGLLGETTHISLWSKTVYPSWWIYLTKSKTSALRR